MHIINHLDNKGCKTPALENNFHYSWSIANLACRYSRLSILKHLIQNEIGTNNLDENLLTTASKYSNEEIITYLLDSEYVYLYVNKSFLCTCLDNNHNLNSTDKTTLKNKIKY